MKKMPPPGPDEDFSEFMDRCVDELGDVQECAIIWQEEKGDAAIVRKTHASKVEGMNFVMSDETPDRMDDIILSDGWDLEHFKRNPIALFGHQSDFPIGTWENVRVENKQLKGKLELAPAGTSARIDELRKLIDAGILKAVSVGFKPKASRPRPEKDGFGVFFTKQELIETSLVSVPANPNALAIAKSLHISPAVIDEVFAEQGKEDRIRRRGFSGKQADMSRRKRGVATMSLSNRIEAAEGRLTEKKDTLAALYEKVDDTNVTDEQAEQITKANQDIAQAERSVQMLRDSERLLGESAEDPKRSGLPAIFPVAGVPAKIKAPAIITSTRPFNVAQKKLTPIDLLIRAGTVQLFSHIHKKPVDDIRRTIYGDDEATRAVVDWAVRAASAPAMTTVVGWAAELVQQIVVDFMETLMPKSVYPRLSAAGLPLNFGRNGKIVIPTRSRTPTIAGSFVGEGLPIPVRQGAFTSQTLTPKKMAVITTWTREIDEHSVPAIEGLLRNAIGEDTAISLDAVLLDANPATLVRPAGILNGVASLTPTAGGGFTALVGDIKQISGALLTGTAGNVRNPVWLMNPQQMNSAGLIAMPGAGVFPFRDEIGQNRLGGWPIIDAGTIPLGTVIAIDAGDFVSVQGDAPRFEISDQATLHMEDTAPSDISTTGTPAVVAYPVKSMWQTDMLALRMILPINWAIRRTGTVAWVAGVTW
jgi:HK97 family phage prohead protease